MTASNPDATPVPPIAPFGIGLEPFQHGSKGRTIAVVEPSSLTAPTLQRQFRESATVCPLASLADLNAASGVALLVIRLGDQVAPMVRELAVIKSRTPRLPIIVITADRFVSLEWTLREIGINAVISEFTPPPQFTAICRSLIDPPE